VIPYLPALRLRDLGDAGHEHYQKAEPASHTDVQPIRSNTGRRQRYMCRDHCSRSGTRGLRKMGQRSLACRHKHLPRIGPARRNFGRRCVMKRTLDHSSLNGKSRPRCCMSRVQSSHLCRCWLKAPATPVRRRRTALLTELQMQHLDPTRSCNLGLPKHRRKGKRQTHHMRRGQSSLLHNFVHQQMQC